MRFITSILLIGLVGLSVFAQNGPADQNQVGVAGTFAITNATVYTVSGDVIQNGTVVIRDGKISAVGANARMPGGATVYISVACMLANPAVANRFFQPLQLGKPLQQAS